MEKTDRFRKALSRGEQLFAKKSYVAAKKELDYVLRIAPNEDIQEKVRICEEQIRIERRKEQIKKARKLEKKGDLSGALDCFTAASTAVASIALEPWLQDKITQLRHCLETEQAQVAVEKADDEEDPATRLAIYDRALTRGDTDPALVEKKAGCLVEMGRYEEAVRLYTEESASESLPQSMQGRYDLGYARIARGQYLEGLAQWEPLLPGYRALFPQIIALLPYLAKELEHKRLAEADRGYALPRRILAIIAQTISSEIPSEPQDSPLQDNLLQDKQLIGRYLRYFDYCYLKELWYTGNHRKIPGLLSSPLRPRDVPFLAKVYLSLSESDVDYLGPAITYWLTAIYNRHTLRSLHVHQAIPDVPDDEILRDGLLELLDKQLSAHARADRLSPSLKAHWQTERQQIARLAALPIEPEGAPASPDRTDPQGASSGGDSVDSYERYFPCTPAFAREFGISDAIVDLLQEKKDEIMDGATLDEQDWFELCAGYLPLGQYMEWIEPGNEEKIFKALPDKTPDRETNYLRQRIAFRCAINRVRAGGRHSRKYFQVAIPLLAANPHLRRELIDLVYGDTSEKVISSLSDAMEFLGGYMDDTDFLEAAAHCIGLEVENLMAQGVSANLVEKRLNVGLAIHPDCPQIQTALQSVRREQNFRRVDKAMKTGNLIKAARLIFDSKDEVMEGLFFDAAENGYLHVTLNTEEDRVIPRLRELYEACSIVDEKHWLVERLEEELAQRGVEL
uniref:Tetratricopeptide repeat-containing protein n=1 Tax=Candidatus Kentrum sp. FM TaxID=2126340 RepID=A0A450WIE3_9GAMM|nr:MAG: hypothetical protein BECKFM1743C_GA0114222_104841 [Candidatus Kentron sp. FM]VFJ68845.1 MAG: hypothetical protein BECKFM1743A_GA0114220_104861 [Candidatus Kentron sp. FM]VFK16792.1 MAG: hypothetical protein BECKFM1743B_GA0114221_104442 [Candidatus Kentron sp. FM]